MIKPIVKTLSLSFVMLAGASIAPATEQIPLLNLASVPADTLRVGCSTTAEIERGWEAQQQLLQERLAAKAAETVQVPAVISNSTAQQTIQLYYEDFNTGAPAFTLNTSGIGSNSGPNQWIINNSYSGNGLYPDTPDETQTFSGTIA